ncbi:MAG: DoxX family protein [Bacteroidia bacterium]|nr:DoxX family protein [Bacteroidia bacterium]
MDAFLLLNSPLDADLLHGCLFVAQILASSFLAVLFLQSGLDKVFDWKGNLSWLSGHFARTPLGGMVTLMLGVVTVTEVSAGALSALGALALLFFRTPTLALIGAELSGLSILMLFFGQRIAKDYAGAATLVSYFILVLLTILLLSGAFQPGLAA